MGAVMKTYIGLIAQGKNNLYRPHVFLDGELIAVNQLVYADSTQAENAALNYALNDSKGEDFHFEIQSLYDEVPF